MSYPRHIRTLIIEDEQGPIDNYAAIFTQLKAKFDLAPPLFARSYEDAIAHLSNNLIFHLVIVDLGLPQTAHETAETGIEPGFEIVKQCANRENYPIPGVLVISGRLGQANLAVLQESLKRSFWHGEMVNKGIDEADAIEKALNKINDYCGVGIFIRDGGNKLHPTLSPREDDLLRRCVLDEPYCVGVDFEWWGAYQGISVTESRKFGITKVLWGRFLLNESNDPSRPWFFKFESAENAKYTQRDLALMVQKLSHIKRCSVKLGAQRSLIVTQQVGDSSARPISLAELFAKPTAEISATLPSIASEIAAQLTNLGSINEERLPASKLLWNYHDLAEIKAAYLQHNGDAVAAPVALLEKIQSVTTPIWVNRRNCTHGDLNATNIALESAASSYRAFIIDAAGMRVETAGRDLAMLEVTTLLHLKTGSNGSCIELCRALYSNGTSLPELPLDAEKWPHTIRNIFLFVCEIRKQALHFNKLPIYGLLVFDCAMLQLGGLSLQSRDNKITNPHDAVLLANLAADWLKTIAPDELASIR